LIWRCNAVCLC